ncbi:MAG: hypothetical protein ABFD00_10215 [Chloroherpetonaceae bacterium]
MTRLITNFNGVATNGKSVLCYGNYGIITYSQNLGQTWREVNIGDKYNILEIIANDSNYYGITGYSLIKSTDNGNHWENIEISQDTSIKSFTLINNTIYALSQNGLFSYDLDLNQKSEELIFNDPESSYQDLNFRDGQLLFIKNNIYLMKYTIGNKMLDSINIFEKVKDYLPTVAALTDINVQQLRISNGNIYLLCKYSLNGMLMQFFFKSTNNGINWISIPDPLIIHDEAGYISINTIFGKVSAFNIFDDSIFFIRSPEGYNDYHSIYQKLDSGGNPKVVSKISEESFFDRGNYFNDFIKIGTDTIIAVGNYKLISISYNNGKTWELKSMIAKPEITNPYTMATPELRNPHIVNDKFILCHHHQTFDSTISAYIFCKTTNGGITWLPPYSASMPPISEMYFSSFNENGTGWIVGVNKKKEEIILHTSDYADNYQLYSSPIHIGGSPDVYSLNDGGLMLYNVSYYDSLYVLRRIKDKIYFLNNFDEPLASIELKDSLFIFDIDNGLDNVLYSLWYKESDWVDSDSGSFYLNTKYYLRKSIDNGRNWATLPIDLPLYPFFVKSGTKAWKLSPVDGLYYHKNFLLILCGYYLDRSLLYIYDIKNNKLDSVGTSITSDNRLSMLFSYKDDLYATSNNNKYIFRINNLGTNNIVYDSIPMTSIVSDWIAYDPTKTADENIGKSQILSVKTNSNFIFLEVQKYTGKDNFGFPTSSINYIKLSSDSITTGITNETVEKGDAFLFKSNTYPIPASDIVRSTVYWNSAYNIMDAQIDIYNMYGIKQNNPEISIEKQADYKANIVWNCSGYSAGVYFIRITLGGETMAVPVLINRGN